MEHTFYAIESLKKVSILDIIGRYIEIKKHGKDYLALCPFHEDHTPSLSISAPKNIYKCFACGNAGDGIKFIQEFKNIPFIEACEIIAEIGGINLPPTRSNNKQRRATGSNKGQQTVANNHYSNIYPSETHSNYEQRTAINNHYSNIYPSETHSSYEQRKATGSNKEQQTTINNHYSNIYPSEIHSNSEQQGATAYTLLEDHYPETTLKRNIRTALSEWILQYFGQSDGKNMIEKYFVAGAKQRFKGSENNAVIFWYISIDQQVRRGKIMTYQQQACKWDQSITDIKREKNRDGKGFVSSIHKQLYKENYQLPPESFFGEHLLKSDFTKPVAIVESEKTAIIASHFYPQYHWLATGSLGSLTYSKIKVLENFKIVLFPDLGKPNAVQPFDIWNKKAVEFRKKYALKIRVDDTLQRYASEEMKKEGCDLADFLIAENLHYPLYWNKPYEISEANLAYLKAKDIF